MTCLIKPYNKNVRDFANHEGISSAYKTVSTLSLVKPPGCTNGAINIQCSIKGSSDNPSGIHNISVNANCLWFHLWPTYNLQVFAINILLAIVGCKQLLPTNTSVIVDTLSNGQQVFFLSINNVNKQNKVMGIYGLQSAPLHWYPIQMLLPRVYTGVKLWLSFLFAIRCWPERFIREIIVGYRRCGASILWAGQLFKMIVELC